MKKCRVAVLATGENFGPERVRGQLQSTLDALTGEQRYAHIRFDDSGQVFNIDPADVTPELRALLGVPGAAPDYPQLNAYLLNSALDRQAIAPLWEVQTAKMQGTAGDPNAGLLEEERAAKAGLAAALDSAYAQSHPNDVNAKNKRVGQFMPIGIDLDALTGNSAGVGSVSTLSNAQTGITFDWDGQGYQKQTGWIAGNDGFLVLDRNFNGSVDSGTELFSNSRVSDDYKGVHSLNGVLELRSLTDWGIRAIDYGNSRYEFGSVLGTNGKGYGSIATQTRKAEGEMNSGYSNVHRITNPLPAVIPPQIQRSRPLACH